MQKSKAAGAAIAFFLVSTSAYAQVVADEKNQFPDTGGGAGAIYDEMTDGEDIVVTAGKPRGSVVVDVEPELVLSAQDIRGYGASNLNDLISELAAQTGSSRGRGGERPVVLLNGKRISGFREIHSIPPEAISRMEILPEEAALAYGYKADQKVLNIVLRERFRAITGEFEVGAPTAGGMHDFEIEATNLRIQGDNRLIFDFSLNSATSILESERDITQSAGQPYAIAGNIVSTTNGGEIDPALSALAGSPVLVTGVPAQAANGAVSLGSFLNPVNNADMAELGRYRTLSPAKTEISGGVSLTRPINQDIQLTVSGNLTKTDSESLQGLARADLLIPAGNPYSPFGTDVKLLSYASAPGALGRKSDSWNGRLSAALNGMSSGWQWSVTASHDHDESETTTSRSLDLSDVTQRLLDGDPTFNPFAINAINGPLLQDRATSNSDRSLIEAVANKRLLDLPAGGLMATFKLGGDHRDQTSFTTRSGIEREINLKRTIGEAQASIDVPIANRNRDILQPLGDLSINANVASQHYSDFGDLMTWGGGVTWRPIDAVQIIASYTSEDGAPSIQQLGNPTIVTPNVRVFDYVTGQTVDITSIDGGNAALNADRRHTWKIGGRIQPIPDNQFSIQADYVRTRINNPIAGFPTATAEIEAAFPDRFVRDNDGRLLSIDNRPVNFARSERSELRWGINFFEKLEPTKAEQAKLAARRAEMEKMRQMRDGAAPSAGAPAGGPPPAAGAGAPPRGPGMRGPGMRGNPGEGRLQISAFHTVRFTDSILIRDGLPELDLLGGSATGNNGGVSRHEIEVRSTISKNGVGARLSGSWSSGTHVSKNPNGAPSDEDLHFSSLAKVNLRLFADLGQQVDLVKKMPFLRGSRVSLGVDNLFDSRMSVRTNNGITPLNYQPDYMDPVGRRVEISFRKLFF